MSGNMDSYPVDQRASTPMAHQHREISLMSYLSICYYSTKCAGSGLTDTVLHDCIEPPPGGTQHSVRLFIRQRKLHDTIRHFREEELQLQENRTNFWILVHGFLSEIIKSRLDEIDQPRSRASPPVTFNSVSLSSHAASLNRRWSQSPRSTHRTASRITGRLEWARTTLAASPHRATLAHTARNLDSPRGCTRLAVDAICGGQYGQSCYAGVLPLSDVISHNGTTSGDILLRTCPYPPPLLAPQSGRLCPIHTSTTPAVSRTNPSLNLCQLHVRGRFAIGTHRQKLHMNRSK